MYRFWIAPRPRARCDRVSTEYSVFYFMVLRPIAAALQTKPVDTTIVNMWRNLLMARFEAKFKAHMTCLGSKYWSNLQNIRFLSIFYDTVQRVGVLWPKITCSNPFWLNADRFKQFFLLAEFDLLDWRRLFTSIDESHSDSHRIFDLLL